MYFALILIFKIAMQDTFTFSDFKTRFPDDNACLEEIKRIKYPKGMYCYSCRKITRHYKLESRPAYSCKFCRVQTYPLADTAFEKTTTPLRLWLYAFFLMTHTKAGMSAKQLQRELDVTYKTAWRIYTLTRKLMEQHHGDLLKGPVEIEERRTGQQPKIKIRRWTLFNKLEITITERTKT